MDLYSKYPFLKNESKYTVPTERRMAPVNKVHFDYDVEVNQHYYKVI